MVRPEFLGFFPGRRILTYFEGRAQEEPATIYGG